jgi:hypothetical protein
MVCPVHVKGIKRVSKVRLGDKIFDTTEGNVGLCEMDTHADTSVAGSNFIMCEFDGTTCEVSPFTDEYQSMTDVPIVSAATAWTDDESGETVILWFNQILWYGNKLDHSLINPNQLRHNGVSVCDDITDRNRRFGIDIHGDLFIPFEMKGTVISFESRVPTKWELQNCRIVTVTSDEVWDPTKVRIAAVSPNGSRDPDDGRLENPLRAISDAYDESIMLKQMISAVRVSRTSNVAYLGTKNRHSQVTAEEVAKKFRCGLEMA